MQKKVDLRENEMLKEIERIKRTRKETEACNRDLSGKNSHLTDELEASKKSEDYLRTTLKSLGKQKSIFKDQISSQKAIISDSEKKAKEAISEWTWYKDQWSHGQLFVTSNKQVMTKLDEVEKEIKSKIT